jgi:hypothetical protein
MEWNVTSRLLPCSGQMRALLLAASFIAAVFPSVANGQGPEGWDGANPFVCTLQQVGTGTEFPQPQADPFCVEFEKRHQNVDQLGVVDFLSKEPARVAAASDKCFYFQSDHWRGTASESVPESETYAWDGHYYFNKATGAGGVYVENFRVGGQSGDPTAVPGFPEEWKRYFSQGRGGVQAAGQVEADPRCATRPNPSGPGGSDPGPGGAPASAPHGCRVPGGRVRRGIGGVRLGMKRARARRALGLPMTESRRWMTWCFDGGGRLYAAFGRVGAELVLTDSAPFDTHRIRRGTRRRVALRRLRGERRLGRVNGAAVYVKRERRRRLLVGMRSGRVAYLAVTRRKTSNRRALRYLRTLP